MIWHPLALAILWADALTCMLAALAALQALRITAHWQPESAEKRQIQLELGAEAAALHMRWASVFNGAASLMFLFGTARIFPDVVAGAMCGTGVLQAFGRFGWPAVWLRLAAFGGLWAAGVVDRLNAAAPTQPLTRTYARIILLITPLIALGEFYTLRALLQAAPGAPVSCCTAVYARMPGVTGESWFAAVPDTLWWAVFAMGAAVLSAPAAALYRAGAFSRRRACRALVFSAAFWIPPAAVTLVAVLAPYHYHVMQHHCPWCFFLADHHGRGFILFGALLLAAVEAPAALISDRIAAGRPPLAQAAYRRRRKAAGRVLLSLVVFLAFALAPVVLWRLDSGVWLSP